MGRVAHGEMIEYVYGRIHYFITFMLASGNRLVSNTLTLNIHQTVSLTRSTSRLNLLLAIPTRSCEEAIGRCDGSKT